MSLFFFSLTLLSLLLFLAHCLASQNLRLNPVFKFLLLSCCLFFFLLSTTFVSESVFLE